MYGSRKYDESIQVYDDEDFDYDDDKYEQIVTGRGRLPPVRSARPPNFQDHSSRAAFRTREFRQRSDSLEEIHSADDGSPAPLPLGDQKEKERQLKGGSLRKMTIPSGQQSVIEEDKNRENLISLAGPFAKRFIPGGSDKKKDKPSSDTIESSSKRESKGESSSAKESESKNTCQNAPHFTQKSSTSTPAQKAKFEDENDEEDDEYGLNIAQIEGLLKEVDQIPPKSAMKQRVPHPPPGTPPPYAQRKLSYTQAVQQRYDYDNGTAGESYSVKPLYYRQPPATPTYSSLISQQFSPGFGPATASLMKSQNSEDEFTDTEISITETDMDLAKMENLLEMYGADGHATLDPAMMMAIPAPNLNNIAVLDDEIMENLVTHRRLWESNLDLKREKLKRRTLVMSDFLGVHAPDYQEYNAQDYEHLTVTSEIIELFHHISCYQPPINGSELDVKLKPFLPEYYPSVGDIDAFIKVVHPEVDDEALGIKHLDEPSPFQSDPSVLDLRLRALAKQSSSKSVVVKKIENVGKNAKIIENWIKDISDLHKSKPSPSVHYSKPMPDIDSLIQEWPTHFEDLLKNLSLPQADLNCDLSTFVDIVCNLLDIPIYKSRIQSLHVLFSVYATYKYFNQYGPLGGLDGDTNEIRGGGERDLDDGEINRLKIS